MDLIQSLTNIGLNEKEAKVYLSLLQMGKSTAYTIAKHSGLKKPTTYVVLESLIKKGFTSKVPRLKVMHYVAMNPETVFAMSKSKLAAAEETLPELKSLHKGKDYRVRASYYEGLDGIKQMYDKLCKTMEGKEYVAFYAHGKDTPLELFRYFEELNERQRKLRIRKRGITVNHPSIQQHLTQEYAKKYFTLLKVLPEKSYNSNISIEVYKHFTQIHSHRYLQGIVIDNPDIAHVMKQIFEFVWEKAETE